MAERPSRKQDDSGGEGAGTAEKPTRKPSNGRRKAAAASNGNLAAVYYEAEDGTLTPVGEFAGRKPENVLEAYFEALNAEDRQGAYDARDYVVSTGRGLVKLAANATVTISRR